MKSRRSAWVTVKNLAISALMIGGGLFFGYDTLWKMSNLQPMNWMNRATASSSFALRPGETLWWIGGIVAVLIALLAVGFGVGGLWLHFRGKADLSER